MAAMEEAVATGDPLLRAEGLPQVPRGPRAFGPRTQAGHGLRRRRRGARGRRRPVARSGIQRRRPVGSEPLTCTSLLVRRIDYAIRPLTTERRGEALARAGPPARHREGGGS